MHAVPLAHGPVLAERLPFSERDAAVRSFARLYNAYTAQPGLETDARRKLAFLPLLVRESTSCLRLMPSISSVKAVSLASSRAYTATSIQKYVCIFSILPSVYCYHYSKASTSIQKPKAYAYPPVYTLSKSLHQRPKVYAYPPAPSPAPRQNHY